jgi:hypothetical protein
VISPLWISKGVIPLSGESIEMIDAPPGRAYEKHWEPSDKHGVEIAVAGMAHVLSLSKEWAKARNSKVKNVCELSRRRELLKGAAPANILSVAPSCTYVDSKVPTPVTKIIAIDQ